MYPRSLIMPWMHWPMLQHDSKQRANSMLGRQMCPPATAGLLVPPCRSSIRVINMWPRLYLGQLGRANVPCRPRDQAAEDGAQRPGTGSGSNNAARLPTRWDGTGAAVQLRPDPRFPPVSRPRPSPRVRRQRRDGVARGAVSGLGMRRMWVLRDDNPAMSYPSTAPGLQVPPTSIPRLACTGLHWPAAAPPFRAVNPTARRLTPP